MWEGGGSVGLGQGCWLGGLGGVEWGEGRLGDLELVISLLHELGA